MNEVNVLLFQGTWIVSEVEEIEECPYGMPDCVLKYPCEIKDGELIRWPPHTNLNEIPVRSSDVSIIVDPSEEVLNLYKKYIVEME